MLVRSRQPGTRWRRVPQWVAAALALAPFALGAATPLSPHSLAMLGPAPRIAGGAFANPTGPMGHGSTGVRLAFFLRRMAGAEGGDAGRPERVENDGARLRANAGLAPTVTWVGHASLLVQMDGVSFLTDPIWSKTASPVRWLGPQRFVEPGIAVEALPQIDFVVVSHNHYDHLDLRTLRILAERDPATRFFVPLGNADLLRRNGIANLEELDWGQQVEVEGVAIRCLPAQHWSKRSLADDNESLWSSWAIQGGTRNFYFAGDTGYSDHFRRIGEALGPFDLAAVPIGAYEPVAMMRESHLNPEEAATAASDLRADRAVAMHFGTFDLSDEPLAEPPRRFLAAMSEPPAGRAWVLRIGETRSF